MSQETSSEHSHAMQNETRQTTPAAAFGRSSVKRLPPELREAVDAAIADGATIDEITARIRAEGEDCSRSAVGRYAKDMRDLIRQQQETDRTVKAWVDALGERPEGQTALIMIETLRTMVLATMAHLSKREEPASMEELARLSLTLKRIEGTDKLRKDSERAAKKAAQANQPKHTGGLSPEVAAIIRAEVEGRSPPPLHRKVTTAPVDPWDPELFPAVLDNPGESHSIPVNPAERWPEIAPGVFRTSPTSILSLGRSEARSRAVSRDTTASPDTRLDPLLADRTPERDAGRDPGDKCGSIPADPGASRPKSKPTASRHIAHPTWPCPPPL
ncbi:MAG: DUF3486 family protein [Rhodospirillales bacterium]|nr:DUF3486 family protein [Rhodospirillales bacterium]